MLHINGRVPLPPAFYGQNGELATKVLNLITARRGELPDLTVNQISELAGRHPQEFDGNPTFAKAVVDLIEKVKTTAEDKVTLLRDLAKMTIVLQRMKA